MSMDEIRASFRPFLGEPEQGVDLRCEHAHHSRLYLSHVNREMAEDYARMVEASGPEFESARNLPGSTLGRCQMPMPSGPCGAHTHVTVFGFE